ncbi:AMP-binding protein [Sphingopyxis panaciterrulae]|uniref:Bile acid-coenzyme A ligase n=1 Tax=Sphingopyxis panaciterrulae TaxID=462372 RepID=A0A7W9B3C0_9SPHN|nr:AMP-binding protein [Sphingopyxis panaciterrulae]MBB5705473.1 bile acid-coenzyme A ligase [Sphingopyxis panaciterrulae]
MAIESISFAAKLADHARTRPERPAVTCGDDVLTYGELHRRSNRLAHGLRNLGTRQGDLVSVALPNGVDFVAVCHAIWKLGATPQPLSFRLPTAELEAIVALGKPRIVVGDPAMGERVRITSVDEVQAAGDADVDLPDAVAAVAKAPTSGGSTGRPKLILSGTPGLTPAVTPEVGDFQLNDGSIALLPGPLYHNAPFTMMMLATAYGAHVVLLPRFDAEAMLRAIARHRVTWACLVPTMMSRAWRLPPEVRDSFDISSLRTVWHMAAPCPAWLKEAFVDWIAPAVLMELYAGTEAISSTVISGAEWLQHRGSVGRVAAGEMKVVGPDGESLPPGEVGEIYMRPASPDSLTYRYLGAEAKTLPGGWQTLGDLGWFDADGYLFLADRRSDLILVGGANVYPAEIEGALEEHPAVQSCAVVGLPDEDMGARVHAIVQVNGPVTEAELLAHLTDRLVTYKVPRSFEFVDESLRDEAGKVRRMALRDART